MVKRIVAFVLLAVGVAIGVRADFQVGNLFFNESGEVIRCVDGIEVVDIPSSVSYTYQEWDREAQKYVTKTKTVTVSAIHQSAFLNGGTIYPDSGGNNNSSRGRNIRSVHIPNTVRKIGNSAFDGCTKIIELNIPGSVTNICTRAFRGCTGLSALTLNDGLVAIGESAFGTCTNLSTVAIPPSLKIVSSSAFSSCQNISRVDITDFDAWCRICFATENSSPLCECKDNSLWLNGEPLAGNIVLPNDIGYVYPKAFRKCSRLAGVTIPDKVKKICESAFEGCTNITELAIGEGVTNIARYAFRNCSRLEALTIPKGVVSIGKESFSGCKALADVYVSKSVREGGNNAFKDCSSITNMVLPFVCNARGVSVKNINSPFYSGLSVWFNRYVPASLKTVTITDETAIGDYAFYQCSGLTNITINSGVSKIGACAFERCLGLIDVEIPSSVTSIGGSAFSETPLRSVRIPRNVKSIGAYAFSSCTNLNSVYIPPSVKSIGIHAFNGCTRLNSAYITDLAAWCDITFGSDSSGPNYGSGTANPIWYSRKLYLNGELVESADIPEGAPRVSDYAFYNYPRLKNVTIPHTVTNIGKYAFSKCTGIRDMTIPGNVVLIGERAFAECPNLRNVAISPGVKTIGEYAFLSCTGLGDITVPDSVKYINENAFTGCTSLTNMVLPFVGLSRGNDGSQYSVFGHLFRSPSGSGTESVMQYYSPSSSIWSYLPKSLRTVRITDETCLGYGAFYNCKYLTEIAISGTVTNIGGRAFYSCTNLKKLVFEGDCPNVISNSFEGIGSSCKACLPRGNRTYTVTDGKWQGMTVEYYDLEPEPPVIAIDDTKMEEPVVDEETGVRTIVAKDGETLTQRDVESITIKATIPGEASPVDTTAGYEKTLVGNEIVVTLKTPEMDTTVNGEVKKEGDSTGMLAEVGEGGVELSTDEPAPSEADIEAGNTEVAALPVKAVRGLFYQASWGANIEGMTQGQKVQATGDTLYLGVIKQKGDKGFYKLSVSEK